MNQDSLECREGFTLYQQVTWSIFLVAQQQPHEDHGLSRYMLPSGELVLRVHGRGPTLYIDAIGVSTKGRIIEHSIGNQ
jgi:hypothetical protein